MKETKGGVLLKEEHIIYSSEKAHWRNQADGKDGIDGKAVRLVCVLSDKSHKTLKATIELEFRWWTEALDLRLGMKITMSITLNTGYWLFSRVCPSYNWQLYCSFDSEEPGELEFYNWSPPFQNEFCLLVWLIVFYFFLWLWSWLMKKSHTCRPSAMCCNRVCAVELILYIYTVSMLTSIWLKARVPSIKLIF